MMWAPLLSLALLRRTVPFVVLRLSHERYRSSFYAYRTAARPAGCSRTLG
jgi:hypothetical protein